MDNYSEITSGKDINYLSKDFNSFKQNLVEYVKSYYPGTYKDFSENSTGMMFIELASYVGDVLSYYIDYQFKEGFMQYASERNNVVTLANYLGYKPKPSTAAATDLDIMQLVPSKIEDDGRNVPDMKFALNIRPGMEVLPDGAGGTFRTLDSVNFAEEDPTRPTEIQVFQRDGNGQPTFYLLKKVIRASAGSVKEMTISVGEAEEFFEVEIPDTNVLEIESVTDASGNKWYEVPYLAQDTVFIDVANDMKNDPKI